MHMFYFNIRIFMHILCSETTMLKIIFKKARIMSDFERKLLYIDGFFMTNIFSSMSQTEMHNITNNLLLIKYNLNQL